MTILRNTIKSACLMVFIVVAAIVVILIIGFVSTEMRFDMFGEAEQPITSPYVQNIIQPEPASWYLSPLGDKLLYDTTSGRKQAIVRFLATGQEFTITDCSRFSWLDNEHVYCYDFYDNDYEPFVATIDVTTNVDHIQKSLIKEETVEQIELESLLKQAKTIYKLHPSSKPDTLLVLATGQQENEDQYYHIIGIENLDEVLSDYTHTTIPLYDRFAEPSKKIYSPNGQYYYLLQDTLRIYNATSDQLLAEFVPPPNYRSFFQIGGFFPNKTQGWAVDNSGVYFQVFHPGGFGPPTPTRPIQKLCVPDASGCPPTN